MSMIKRCCDNRSTIVSHPKYQMSFTVTIAAYNRIFRYHYDYKLFGIGFYCSCYVLELVLSMKTCTIMSKQWFDSQRHNSKRVDSGTSGILILPENVESHQLLFQAHTTIIIVDKNLFDIIKNSLDCKQHLMRRD